jgi:serine protease DegQ
VSIGLALAVAVGCLGACAFPNAQSAAGAPMSTYDAEPGQPAVIVSYRSAVSRAAPSVVTVRSAHTLSAGRLPSGPSARMNGIASGVIVGSDGYIVTNYHAVQGASGLAVAMADGAVHLTRVVGADPESDIALLKIEAEGLRTIALADINDVSVGDVVLAMGNPLGIGQTVTQGIVSAIVRTGPTPIENFIQTDAAINPGNSGGALIDTAGRLVGINTLILTRSGGSEGLGFAIPVDLVQTVAALLKSEGRVARAWLGLKTRTAPRGDGALVVAVERDGPAERAGIAPGDLIVGFRNKQVRHAMDVTGVVLGAGPAEHVSIDLVRNGRRSTVEARLAPVPAQPAP